ALQGGDRQGRGRRREGGRQWHARLLHQRANALRRAALRQVQGSDRRGADGEGRVVVLGLLQRRGDGDFPLSAVAQPLAPVCPPERAVTQPLPVAPWPERAVAQPLALPEPTWPCASPPSAHALLPPLEERPLEERWLVSESRTFRAVVALLASAAETLLPTPWAADSSPSVCAHAGACRRRASPRAVPSVVSVRIVSLSADSAPRSSPRPPPRAPCGHACAL